MSAAEAVFENPLKDAHAVARGGRWLFVTDDACLRGSEGLRRLVTALPRRGTEREFRAALGETGTGGTFEALVGSGALQKERRRSALHRLAKALLTPRLRLLGADLQERAFAAMGLGETGEARLFALHASVAVLGALLSLAAASDGVPSAAVLPTTMLIFVGMIAHELGHSSAAYRLGLGARPIGAGVYLFCPVLFTNVSGVRTLGLRGRLAVGLGGFAWQTAFMAVLGAAWAVSGWAAAGRAMGVLAWLLLFNLNPLLHTDGYWCLQDAYEAVRGRPWARVVRTLYLAAFSAYTVYLAWFGLAFLRRALAAAAWTPEGVGRLLLAGFVAVQVGRGLWGRFQEVRRDAAREPALQTYTA